MAFVDFGEVVGVGTAGVRVPVIDHDFQVVSVGAFQRSDLLLKCRQRGPGQGFQVNDETCLLSSICQALQIACSLGDLLLFGAA
ncbi:hypothetical protein D3C73_1513900 [compost metagenome]